MSKRLPTRLPPKAEEEDRRPVDHHHAKVSHDDQLFGSVGTRDVVAALAEKGFTLDPRQVHLHESWKQLGSYSVELGLHKTVIANITVNVIDSDPEGKSLKETIDEATGAEQPAEQEA